VGLAVIDGTENMPSSAAYRSRFGNLLRAYRLIGYTPARDYRYLAINRHLRHLHADTVREVIGEIAGLGGTPRSGGHSCARRRSCARSSGVSVASSMCHLGQHREGGRGSRRPNQSSHTPVSISAALIPDRGPKRVGLHGGRLARVVLKHLQHRGQPRQLARRQVLDHDAMPGEVASNIDAAPERPI
jgi:hypothetical protein